MWRPRSLETQEDTNDPSIKLPKENKVLISLKISDHSQWHGNTPAKGSSFTTETSRKFWLRTIATWDKIWHTYTLCSNNQQPIIRTWWKVLTHRVIHKIWKCMSAAILGTSDKDKSLPSKSVWGNKQHTGKPLTYQWGSFWYQQCHTENKRLHCMTREQVTSVIWSSLS